MAWVPALLSACALPSRVSSVGTCAHPRGHGRPHQVEREMVIFSRHCELCFNTAREKLFACDACYMVSYCCEEHQQEHQAEHSKYCHRYLFAHRCLQALRVSAVCAAPRPSSCTTQSWPFTWVGGPAALRHAPGLVLPAGVPSLSALTV